MAAPGTPLHLLGDVCPETLGVTTLVHKQVRRDTEQVCPCLAAGTTILPGQSSGSASWLGRQRQGQPSARQKAPLVTKSIACPSGVGQVEPRWGGAWPVCPHGAKAERLVPSSSVANGILWLRRQSPRTGTHVRAPVQNRPKRRAGGLWPSLPEAGVRPGNAVGRTEETLVPKGHCHLRGQGHQARAAPA